MLRRRPSASRPPVVSSFSLYKFKKLFLHAPPCDRCHYRYRHRRQAIGVTTDTADKSPCGLAALAACPKMGKLQARCDSRVAIKSQRLHYKSSHFLLDLLLSSSPSTRSRSLGDFGLELWPRFGLWPRLGLGLRFGLGLLLLPGVSIYALPIVDSGSGKSAATALPATSITSMIGMSSSSPYSSSSSSSPASPWFDSAPASGRKSVEVPFLAAASGLLISSRSASRSSSSASTWFRV